MTSTRIPCCLCGAMIEPNDANQCGSCLAQQFDLKSLLNRGPSNSELTIHQCRRCRRYERTEKCFEDVEPESNELLSICLKQIPALNGTSSSSSNNNKNEIQNLSVLDASWIWTEPHSMRLKLRLLIRAEVTSSSVSIQQRVMVEFYIKFKQCPDCHKEYTHRTWHAIVQLRQKRRRSDGGSRRALILLETILARQPQIRKHVLSVTSTRHGFDFYFPSLPHAQSFTSHLSRILPMRIKTTSKLVSTDVKNNTANVKHTLACDILPLCRDDLILLDKRLLTAHGGAGGKLAGHLCLVLSVTGGSIRLVDANPSRQIMDPTSYMVDVHPDHYWKAGGGSGSNSSTNSSNANAHDAGGGLYRLLFGPARFTRYVVLDVELCNNDNNNNNSWNDDHTSLLYKGPSSGISKYALADVVVARESDMGVCDDTYRCVTHLGHLLKVGDIVLGYHLLSSVLGGDDHEAMETQLNGKFILPDVVLVRKARLNEQQEEEETSSALVDNHDDYEIDEQQQEQQQNNEQSKGILNNKKGGGNTKKNTKRQQRRRQRKEGKKMRQLEEAATRMGLISKEEGDEEEDGILNEEQRRKAFVKELEEDPLLAEELDWAEQHLISSSKEEKEDNNAEEKEKEEGDTFDDETYKGTTSKYTDQ